MPDDPRVYTNLYFNTFHFQPCSSFLPLLRPTCFLLAPPMLVRNALSLGNRTVTMNSTSSLNCITCSPQSNLKSTRCSSLPRKCVHEEIILVNSRMKIPFRVLSTNHMPPRKWTFYKENHRKKRLLSGEVPPAPQAPLRKRGLSTQRRRPGAAVLALPLTPSGS